MRGMPTPLADRPLHPAPTGTPALAGAELAALAAELGPSWSIEGGRLRRTWKLPDFASALALAVKLGMLAEKVDHHPDLHVAWGKLAVELWTHTVGGLSEADFVWAARAERIAAG
jgi:4a-hydroxytetrahydrobiopterin dehydratase